ncbi:MAG: UDP-N-acetylmuramoyl-L-alanyl-D-glutamate--2,6-diaminopimelate ligase [Gammaproteobacteria bacterium]
MMTAPDRNPGMTLGELFGERVRLDLAALRVTDIAVDSRRVTPGGLFLACRGRTGHGLDHLSQALERGAVAVAWEPQTAGTPSALAVPIPSFPVEGLGAALGELADHFFASPSSVLDVIGVTGTNGKTTCTHLVACALEILQRPAGLIGTLGSGRPGALKAGRLTTPDAVEVHRSLAQIRDAGAKVAAMEVSSHALDQGRVDGVRFRLAALTNLSREHLDYHGDMARYAAAKSRLFGWPGLGGAVINVDDDFGRDLAARLGQSMEVLSVGRSAAAGQDSALRLRSIKTGPQGLAIEYEHAGERGHLRSPLWGEFNAENLALALGILISLGSAAVTASDALSQVAAPSGRMEAFSAPGRAAVLVDYAHTPDALSKALDAARGHCQGRLFCVFGCGGERDPGKRPEMGRIAETLADVVIVTDDNPRSEDGARIVADIIDGMSASPRVERDRAAAIRSAIAAATPEDVVLVAGKGHEDYQLTAAGRRHFSDRETVVAVLETGRD